MSENARNNGRIFNLPLSFPYQVCLRERPPLASSSSSTADTESGEEEEEEKGSLAREARGEREEGRLPCGLAAAWLPPFSVGGGRPPLAAAFGYYYCSEGKPPLGRRGDEGKDWLGRLSLSTPSCCSPVVAVSRPERPDRENEPTSPR